MTPSRHANLTPFSRRSAAAAFFCGVILLLLGLLTGPVAAQSGTSASLPIDQPNFTQIVLPHRPTVGAAHAVYLRDGQCWLGQIEAASPQGVRLVLEPWGERVTLPIAEVAELVWLRRASSVRTMSGDEATKQGMLHRRDGVPVQGVLESFNGQSLVIVGPIGRFSLPLASLERYVFPHAARGDARGRGSHAVGLTDGSVLFGDVSFGDGRIRLAMTGREPLDLPLGAVHHIRRRTGLHWLAPPTGSRVLVATDAISPATLPTYAQAITLDSGQSLTWDNLPAATTLRFAASLAEHAPDTVNVIVSDGTDELARFNISGHTPQPQDIKLPAGLTGLRITAEADADAPSRVLIADPFVVTAGGGG